MIDALARFLQGLNSSAKTWVMVAVDFAVLNLLVVVSYAIRLSSWSLPPREFFLHYFAGPVFSVFALAVVGSYAAASRGYSRSAEWRIYLSQLMAFLFWVAFVGILGRTGFVRSTLLIYLLLACLSLSLTRQFALWLAQRAMEKGFARRQPTRVLIHGAGREGILLVDSLRRHGRMQPVAFIDPDPTLRKRSLSGLPVFGPDEVAEAMIKYQPTEVLVVRPEQSRAKLKATVDSYISHGLIAKTIPDLEAMTSGNIDLSRMRKFNVEDVLGRDPVPPDMALLAKAVQRKSVLVTGAGGSIGSELVRQIVQMNPEKLVLLEVSEHKLFEIHREMEAQLLQSGADVLLVPVLGSVLDVQLLRDTIRHYGISVVYHAAAYKHVRMVQDNPVAGIEVNVIGTTNVVDAARDGKVSLCVLISTDKAVRPTSIMGASKRVAEMYVQGMAQAKSSTTFAIVRFGNVLASSGSVVPIFQDQIERGGPVQVTDKAATRYFMLIKEAAQLVIQASALSQRGEVFVLDMGESVSIYQLAMSMIELAGLTVRDENHPDGDIEIRIIGLREGEKLNEELYIGSDTTQTSHPRILLNHEVFMDLKTLKPRLQKLRKAVETKNAKQAVSQLLALARWKNTAGTDT